MQTADVLIIGGGAAGLMCAAQAGQRGLSVIVLEHSDKLGEKIRISGGGRCNFSNMHCGPDKFISQNPHFCKSAISRYSSYDFIELLEGYGIAWHEKNPEKNTGQLFCDENAIQIVEMLKSECDRGRVKICTNTEVQTITRNEHSFLIIDQSEEAFSCGKLVIATGGPSIPKIGASGFAYKIARQFDLSVIEPQAALVPLTFTDDVLSLTKSLSGISVDPAYVSCGRVGFKDALLFTHRGLSGPAILQVSSYWKPGESLLINFCPDQDIDAVLKEARKSQPRQMLHNVLSRYLPKRLAENIAATSGRDICMADLPDAAIREVAALIHKWEVKPNGSEGYRTAEITRGGIDTNELSSKTFEVKKVPGLYFIGEAIDVTGQLGGHNFQWAWSSGWCCGQGILIS